MDQSTDIHALIVDDDAEIRRLVADYLAEHGISVCTAADAGGMRRMLATNPINVVLLDIMLPGDSGLALCQQLRAERDVAIILLTALAEESDRVVGLEMGADDYVVKPFSPRELLARMRAVLRRSRDPLPVHRSHGAERLTFEGWRLNVHRRELADPDGTAVTLTGGEFDLLVAFARNPQRVLDRELLLTLTKGRELNAFDRSIDVQLSRLRRKLGVPGLIKTVRGGGYLFTARVTQEA